MQLHLGIVIHSFWVMKQIIDFSNLYKNFLFIVPNLRKFLENLQLKHQTH